MRQKSAFTLIEVLATLLLLAIGVTAIIGMVRYGTRISTTAQMRATALIVAETVTVDPTPGGLTADGGDADGDGWRLVSGTLSTPDSGSYAFQVQGYVDGFYVQRKESSEIRDIVDPATRWAHIIVDVYAGGDDIHLTTASQRILRRTRDF
jgi:prepilin-type N-terminal cleavage/methylation domain-containing protein